MSQRGKRLEVCRVIAISIAALGLIGGAEATFREQVQVWIESNEASDGFTSPPDSPTVIDAFLGTSSTTTHATAGPLGNLALTGSMFGGSSEVGGLVFIESDEFLNLSAVPRTARANFIIDGGFLKCLGGPIATLSFQIILEAKIFDMNHTQVGAETWRTQAIMQSIDFGSPTLSIGHNDIGIHMITPFEAEIPFSFQQWDIAQVPAFGTMELSYQAQVIASADFVEIMSWEFSDPLQLDGPQEFPTVTMVPEPSSVVALGLLALGMVQRRRATIVDSA